MSEVYHKAVDFSKFRIFRKKKGTCRICGYCIYYGIGVEAWDGREFQICAKCAKIIAYIRLSSYCT